MHYRKLNKPYQWESAAHWCCFSPPAVQRVWLTGRSSTRACRLSSLTASRLTASSCCAWTKVGKHLATDLSSNPWVLRMLHHFRENPLWAHSWGKGKCENDRLPLLMLFDISRRKIFTSVYTSFLTNTTKSNNIYYFLTMSTFAQNEFRFKTFTLFILFIFTL